MEQIYYKQLVMKVVMVVVEVIKSEKVNSSYKLS